MYREVDLILVFLASANGAARTKMLDLVDVDSGKSRTEAAVSIRRGTLTVQSS